MNTTNKKYDNLCKAGCIVSIIFASIILVFFSCLFLFLIIYSNISYSLMLLSFIVGQIWTIILCVNVLKEKAEKHITAGVLSLIFSGLIPGILILVGKYEKIDHTTKNKEK